MYTTDQMSLAFRAASLRKWEVCAARPNTPSGGVTYQDSPCRAQYMGALTSYDK